MSDRTILITGAAGLFGGILRTYWGTRRLLGFEAEDGTSFPRTGAHRH